MENKHKWLSYRGFVSGGFEKIVEDPDSRPFCVMESRMPQTSYKGLTQTLTVERYGTQTLIAAI